MNSLAGFCGDNESDPDIDIFHPDLNAEPLREAIKEKKEGELWEKKSLISQIRGVRFLECYLDKTNNTTIPRSEIA